MDKALPFPTEQERRNFFWTRKTPRPTAETYPERTPSLGEVQALWDAADKKVREHEAHVAHQAAEREARATAVAARASAAMETPGEHHDRRPAQTEGKPTGESPEVPNRPAQCG